MNKYAKVRALIACCALAVCFTGFSARLVHLQVAKHDEYATLADESHVIRQTTAARRGLIVDINGQTLADNEPARIAVADGSQVTDAGDAAGLLAGPLGVDESELRDKLASGRRYVVLKKDVPEALALELENRLSVRSIRGITFLPDAERVYPNGALACHVVGFTDGDHKGVAGIEAQEDEYLRGHDGFRYTERDRSGQEELVQYQGQERLPQDGCNVRLNIDLALQNIVETELDAACKEFKPKKAIAIMMRPQTGEILAMANRPNFDPNDLLTKPASYVQEQMGATDNCAISDMIEPGSTFKIVTTSAVLNERLVQPDSMIYCENGAFSYGGRILHDDHPNGELTVEDILVKSSNIGAAKLALLLGDQRLFGYIRAFGFGDRTGVALPGESSGLVMPPNKWSKLSITRIAMGQEVAVTPLQTITAMCAIANGGTLMMPQIVHDITDDKGQVIASFPPVKIRQVISAEEARAEVKALEGVVSARGTAALAQVSGFTDAGKTGTAQKIAPKGQHGYLPGKYIVSFCGFLPAENPSFACPGDAGRSPDRAGPGFWRAGRRARFLAHRGEDRALHEPRAATAGTARRHGHHRAGPRLRCN